MNWIKFNVGQRGFYRVTYDEAGWDALINVLQTEHEILDPADRASLIDDAFTLVEYVLQPCTYLSFSFRVQFVV